MSISLNRDLSKAKKQKNDNFYTQLSDIEKELKHYKNHFEGRIVYCNCDDPIISNFFKFFQLKFRSLGLKKLITTCYKNGQSDLFSKHDQDKSVGIVIDERERSITDLPGIDIFQLNGDGDFRSAECIKLLKQADIVVTNPPFSLFREYVAQLIEYEKKFLILGNQNAITYKEIFPLIKDRNMWLGIDNGGTKWFEVNPDYSIKTRSRQKTENGKKYFSMGNILWYTNLDHAKRHEELILYKKYSPQEYPKYDNYDAIEVDKVVNIPVDYDGDMGVPITFLDKYNPDQFDIIGMDRPLITELTGKQSRFKINGKEIYARVVIRHARVPACKSN